MDVYYTGLTERNKNKPIPPPKQIIHPSPSQPLAPGTAKVSVSILACIEEKEYFSCTMRITKVHEYGAATPPLPLGSEIMVTINKINFKESNPSLFQSLQPENILKMNVSFDQALSLKHSISSRQVIKIY